MSGMERDGQLRDPIASGRLSQIWAESDDGAYRRSAVLVPFLPGEGVWNLLFLKRASHLSKHGGEVCFPGGMKEPGDRTVVETALREMEEETSIPPCQVRPLAVLSPERTVVSAVNVHPVVGVLSGVRSIHDLTLGSEEIQDACVVPYSLFFVPPVLRSVLVHGEKVTYPEYSLPNGWRLWGVSARILHRIEALSIEEDV